MSIANRGIFLSMNKRTQEIMRLAADADPQNLKDDPVAQYDVAAVRNMHIFIAYFILKIN